MKHSRHGVVACYLHARSLLRASSGERRGYRPHSLGQLWLRGSGASRTASIFASSTARPCLTLLTDTRLPVGSDVELCCLNHRGSIDMIRGRIGACRTARRATDLPQSMFVARFEPCGQDTAPGETEPENKPIDATSRVGEML